MRSAPPRGGGAGEAIASGVFLAAFGLVMANRIPFWNGLTALMSVVAVYAAVRLRAAGQAVFAPSLSDTLLGLVLALASWAALRLLWVPLARLVPGFGGGLLLIGGYAAAQPGGWVATSLVAIAVAEELFWRRFLPWRIAAIGGCGSFAAASIAGGVYAAMHLWSGQIFLAAPALGFGLAWGWLSVWRGSPWASITWHVVFDVLVFLLAPPPLLPGI